MRLNFFQIVLCKHYEWNLRYAVSNNLAALRAVTFLSTFLLLNLMSIEIIIIDILGLNPELFSSFMIPILLIGLIILILLRYMFYTKKRYLQLYKYFSIAKPKLLGISAKGITLYYIFLSILLLVTSAFIYANF